MRLRLLSIYGRISYSIYVFHMLFVAIGTYIVMSLGLVGLTKLWVVFPITLVGSFMLSIVTYQYIEKCSILWGRKVSNWLVDKG